ncbi:uncharacterized protein [Venturia canescens]|uniref:uncharacterized protein isoform X2 n=1 Tax=Venturia canescens TaxID=32260 RepID=UPI001C9D4773|nr:uncharacterized protein LOC122406712 isoform X2 [Venturia canescens]
MDQSVYRNCGCERDSLRCWCEAASIEKRVRIARPLVLFGYLSNSWNDLSPEKPLIDNVMTKPMFSFLFTRFVNPANPVVKDDDCPCRILPSKCPLVKVESVGVVKDNLETKTLNNAAFLLLPHDDEVLIDTVCGPLIPEMNIAHFPSQDDYEDYNYTCSKQCMKKLADYPYKKNKVKCLVFLSNQDVIGAASPTQLGNRQTFSGCIVHDLKFCKNSGEEKFCNKSLKWIAILISGPSVRSWTAILPYALRTKAKVLEKLEKLRQKVVLQKHSMAFMFACEGRGERMFREPNVEASAFKQLFPDVPLVGCSGVGEYGNCSIDRSSEFHHQYSTIFMIVTYGRLSKKS